MKKISSYLVSPFQIDLRSLALFRMFFGFIFTLDSIDRLIDVNHFYSEEGLLPLSFLKSQGVAMFPALSWATDHPWYQASLLILQILAGLFFTFGFKTRLASIASVIFCMSIQSRNTLVLAGFDDLFRLFFIISLFLPVQRVWSIDCRNLSPLKKNSYTSLGTVLFLLQLASVYIFSALSKDHRVWNFDFTAIRYALEIDQMAKPIGVLFKEFFPWALKPLTVFVYYLELYGPILLFVPLKGFFTLARYIVISSYILFHYGLFTMMTLHLFPWVCIALWLATIPAHFWNQTAIGKKLEFYFQQFFRSSKQSSMLLNNSHVKKNSILILLKNTNIFIILIFLVLQNFYALDPLYYSNLQKGGWRSFVNILGLQQDWHLFAPYPYKNDAHYLILTHNTDGSYSELITGQHYQDTKNISWKKPRFVSEMFPHLRWQKTLKLVSEAALYQPSFSRWLCAKPNLWRRKMGDNNFDLDPKNIEEVSLYAVFEITGIDGLPGIQTPTHIFTHRCQ